MEFAVELVVGGLQFGRDGFGKLELESIFSGDTSIHSRIEVQLIASSRLQKLSTVELLKALEAWTVRNEDKRQSTCLLARIIAG